MLLVENSPTTESLVTLKTPDQQPLKILTRHRWRFNNVGADKICVEYLILDIPEAEYTTVIISKKDDFMRLTPSPAVPLVCSSDHLGHRQSEPFEIDEARILHLHKQLLTWRGMKFESIYLQVHKSFAKLSKSFVENFPIIPVWEIRYLFFIIHSTSLE